jgi:hypothetical protein
MANDSIPVPSRRDPNLMRKAYEEAKRREPGASHSRLLRMAKVIYTEEWQVAESSGQKLR